MTDYKQLCAELVDELESWIAYGDEIDIANAHVLIDRARAALAEPEPEGLIKAVETIYRDPDDHKDYEDNYQTGWCDACNAVIELLHSREAERYCLGAENITGHCISDLLDRLPTDDD